MIPEGGDILGEDILSPDLLPETGDIPGEICEHGTDLGPPDLQPETGAILGGSTHPQGHEKEKAEAMPPPPLIPPRKRGKSKGTGKGEIIVSFPPFLHMSTLKCTIVMLFL